MPTAENSFDNNASPQSHFQMRQHQNDLLEAAEGDDQVGALTSPSDGLGVIGSFDKRLNRSVMSLGANVKAQTVLGGNPQPRMASLYLVSGLGKVRCALTLPAVPKLTSKGPRAMGLLGQGCHHRRPATRGLARSLVAP